MYTVFTIIYLIYGVDPGWMLKVSMLEILTAAAIIFFERRNLKHE